MTKFIILESLPISATEEHNRSRKIKETGDSNGITKKNMYRCKIPRMQQSAELVKSKFGARSFFIRQNNTQFYILRGRIPMYHINLAAYKTKERMSAP